MMIVAFLGRAASTVDRKSGLGTILRRAGFGTTTGILRAAGGWPASNSGTVRTSGSSDILILGH